MKERLVDWYLNGGGRPVIFILLILAILAGIIWYDKC